MIKEIESKLEEFLSFAKKLSGREKQEAQTFLNHLFEAFGHEGVIECGASFETSIKIENKTYYADLF